MASVSRENLGVGKPPDIESIRAYIQDARNQRTVTDSAHNHTNYSDGWSSIYELVNEAAVLGFESLGLTDHWDPAGISGGHAATISSNDDFDAYFKDIYQWRREAIEDYVNDTDVSTGPDESVPINIVEGAELDWHPQREDELVSALEEADFDAVLLAVHYDTDGNDYRRMQPTRPEAVKNEYFDELLRAASFADENEHILGVVHPDRIEMNEIFDDEINPSDYEEFLEQSNYSDFLPERNGKIAARRLAYQKPPTAYFDALLDSEADYFAGFDTHRYGISSKVDWDMTETEKRLHVLEDQAKDIGKTPERLLEPELGEEVNIPYSILGGVKYAGKIRA